MLAALAPTLLAQWANQKTVEWDSATGSISETAALNPFTVAHYFGNVKSTKGHDTHDESGAAYVMRGFTQFTAMLDAARKRRVG